MVGSPVGPQQEKTPEALGKYVPFARLGNGGMADVFLSVARGPVGFNKLVVVKRLRNPDDNAHVRMFLDEARLSARLSHPNIVNTYEVGEVQGKFFIAMEYLEGQPLQQLLSWLIARNDGLSEPLTAFVAVQALKGLHYAHELSDYDGAPLGVVHRDVSPHNLFLTYGGDVKLLDFGIAKASMNSTHTETGVLKGKVRYMAPEQVTESNVDRRADVFAFGIVLWEMLAHRQLYSGDAITILTKINSEDAPSIAAVRPDVAPELEAIVSKALRRDPNDRFPTAEAMRLALERFLRGKQDLASDALLATMMNEAFASTRDNVRSRIKSFLAALPAQTDSTPSMPVLGQSADMLPSLMEGSNPTGTPLGAVVSDPSMSARPRARWPLALAGLVVVALLATGAVTLRGRTAPAAPATSVASAPTTGRVRVQTMPPGALIEINGKPLDRTPADLVLDAGPQTLVFTLEGYEPEQVTLDVSAATTLDRQINLRAKPQPAPPPTAAPQPVVAAPQSRGGGRPAWRQPAAPPPPAPAPTPTEAPRPKIRVLDEENQ
jgi:serine/threonine-protein kinase